MKKSEFRSLIRQEIRNSLKEARPDDWMHGGHPGEKPVIPYSLGNDSAKTGQQAKGGLVSLRQAFLDTAKKWQETTKGIDNAEAGKMAEILGKLIQSAQENSISAKLDIVLKALNTQLKK